MNARRVSWVVILLMVTLIPLVAGKRGKGTTVPRAQITLSFDDGDKSVAEEAGPVLDSHGFRGVAYIVPNYVGQDGYVTWGDVVALQKNRGWEIGAHSVSHPELTKLGPEAIEQELAESKRILTTYGVTATNFATPYGDYNNEVLAASARHYRSHRPFHDVGMNSWPFNNHLLYVQQVQGGVSLEKVRSYIDDAVAKKQWLILVFHEIVDNPSPDPEEFEYSPKDLQAIVDYVYRVGIPVVTVEEGLAAESPNLLPDESFQTGIDCGWRTDHPNHITLDMQGKGCLPTPKTSIRLTSSDTENAHLFSPKVPVTFGQTYGVKGFLSIEKMTGGEVGFYIEEYGDNDKELPGRYVLGSREKFVEEVAFTYTPSSPEVKSARLQVIVTRSSGIEAYYDAPRWIQAR